MRDKKINCIAVDDEPLALAVLQKYIAAVPALILIGTCSNAVQAIPLLQQPVDLIFLDIQMPEIMGTDFMRTLKKSPKVIFTTAYRKYAVEGFDLDAVDYLLKPISFERFLKAVNKVLQTDMQVDHAAFAKKERNSEGPNCIYVRSNRKMVKVFLHEILYIEGLNDYIKIITTSKMIVTKHLLSSLEETLPKDAFIRIHRSYIIAIDKINSFNGDSIEIEKKELPIGRLFKHDVNKLLNNLSIPFSNNNHPKINPADETKQ